MESPVGRPPIGKIAMTGAERVRRFRVKHGTDKPAKTSGSAADIAALKRELAQAHKRIAELERRGEGQLTRSRREEHGEVGRLRAEVVKLKSDIIKLKAMLQEEPDAAKLRKKVVDQQVEMASMRRAMKQIAKERDEYQSRVKTYGDIIKALHSDRSKQVDASELAAAERLFIALRPLFGEG